MDPRVNPYAPGAGTPPPELAERDAVLADARLAIQRNKAGRSARSFMFVGAARRLQILPPLNRV